MASPVLIVLSQTSNFFWLFTFTIRLIQNFAHIFFIICKTCVQNFTTVGPLLLEILAGIFGSFFLGHSVAAEILYP